MISSRPLLTWRTLLVFAVIFLVVAGVYRRAPVAFLRAESGLYLSLAYADAAAQKKEVRSFFTGSYGGHYTPLAFLGEFVQAKIGGTSRAFWRWRQILGVSVVGAALFGLVVVITSRLSLPRVQQLAIAAALSSVTLFQPAMID